MQEASTWPWGLVTCAMGWSQFLAGCLDGVKTIGTTLHDLRVVPVHLIPIFSHQTFQSSRPWRKLLIEGKMWDGMISESCMKKKSVRFVEIFQGGSLIYFTTIECHNVQKILSNCWWCLNICGSQLNITWFSFLIDGVFSLFLLCFKISQTILS